MLQTLLNILIRYNVSCITII